MQRKLSLFLTLLAWLFATGGQWDLVQTFAWSRMLVNNAETMPMTQAITKTFSGEQCSICVTVQEAKREQSESSPTAVAKATGKVLLVGAPSNLVTANFVSQVTSVVAASLPLTSAERVAPPSPPPRSAV